MAGTSRLVLVLVAALGACATRAPMVQAPVIDQAVTTTQASGKGPASAANADGRCSAKLVAGRIEKSPPSCFVDPHIRETPGVLSYPCSGTGPADAAFGAHRYTGQMNRGEVELVHESELEWDDDHCRWGIKAVIKGNVLASTAATKGLAWTYRDHVVRGTACSGVSNARSTLQVVSAGTNAPAFDDLDEEPEEDDD